MKKYGIMETLTKGLNLMFGGRQNFLDVLGFCALHEIPSQSSAAVAKMDERLAAGLLLAWFFPEKLRKYRNIGQGSKLMFGGRRNFF